MLDSGCTHTIVIGNQNQRLICHKSEIIVMFCLLQRWFILAVKCHKINVFCEK